MPQTLEYLKPAHVRLCWRQEFQAEQERREEMKQQIALAATRLLQDPEQHSRELQPLVQLVSSRDDVVSGTNSPAQMGM